MPIEPPNPPEREGVGWYKPQYADPLRLDPLVVELTDDDGVPHTASWLGSEIRVTHRLNGLPEATLPAVLAKGMLINVGTVDAPSLIWQRYLLFVRLPRRRRLRYDASLRS